MKTIQAGQKKNNNNYNNITEKRQKKIVSLFIAYLVPEPDGPIILNGMLSSR